MKKNRGHSTPGGENNNRSCTICNLYPIEASGTDLIGNSNLPPSLLPSTGAERSPSPDYDSPASTPRRPDSPSPSESNSAIIQGATNDGSVITNSHSESTATAVEESTEAVPVNFVYKLIELTIPENKRPNYAHTLGMSLNDPRFMRGKKRPGDPVQEPPRKRQKNRVPSIPLDP